MLPLPFASALVVGGLFLFTEWKKGRIERKFPPQGRFVAVEGGRIHVTERLPEGEPRATIALIHGASGNQADVMNPLGARLAARGYRVVAPDRPGHGWSDRIAGSAAASPTVQARLLRQAFDAMEIERAIIVGHSWAGALAVDFALRQAEFTSGLVLLSPVTHPSDESITWYNSAASMPGIGSLFTRLVVLPLGLLRLETALRKVFAPEGTPPDYVQQNGAFMVLRPSEFRANSQDVSKLRAFITAQAPRMAAIRAPTAIVAGDSDSVVMTKIHSYGSLRDIPGATLTLLPGVGHSPHHADPDQVVAAIEEVVRRSQL